MAIPDLTDLSPPSPCIPSQDPLTIPPHEPPSYALHLIDTKTRRTNSLPSDEDALPSRLQLMLYHRLLSHLLSPSFDFAAFWTRLGIDSSKPFSPQFVSQADLPRTRLGCLDDLVAAWHHDVRSLCIFGVDPVLTLTYRTRPVESRPRKSRGSSSAMRNYLELLRGVEASLKESVSAASLKQSASAATESPSLHVDSRNENMPTEDYDEDPPPCWESLLESEKGLHGQGQDVCSRQAYSAGCNVFFFI
jgi:exonuclease V